MSARWQDPPTPQYRLPDNWNPRHPSVIAAAKAPPTPPPGRGASTAGADTGRPTPWPAGVHQPHPDESPRGMAVGATVAFLAVLGLLVVGGRSCDPATSPLCAETSCEVER